MENINIKVIYKDLIGLISGTPLQTDTQRHINEPEIWINFNSKIDTLNSYTDEKYDSYRISDQEIKSNDPGFSYISLTLFRQKVLGLINALHTRYFNEEREPFSGSPNTIISQTQNQAVDIRITMVLELQEKIMNKLNDPNIVGNERTFLQKIKDTLGNIQGITQAIQVILSTASSLGLTIDQLMKLLR